MANSNRTDTRTEPGTIKSLIRTGCAMRKAERVWGSRPTDVGSSSDQWRKLCLPTNQLAKGIQSLPFDEGILAFIMFLPFFPWHRPVHDGKRRDFKCSDL